MKKRHVLFLYMIFSTLSLYGQNWLVEGQTWQYEVTGGWNPDLYGTMVMQVQGDSTLEGINCKRIVGIEPNGQQGILYAYAEAERVYVFDAFQDSFVKIYDFTLSVGDTVFFFGSRKYVIDSIGTAPIAGADRRIQIIRLSGSTLDQGTYLVAEGLGLLHKVNSQQPENECSYFFLQESFCDEAVDGRSYRFRCFSEGGATYDPFGLCTLSAEEWLSCEEKPLQLFPNPAQAQCTVSLGIESTAPGRIRVFDAMGRLLLDEVKTLPATIPTEQWPAGIYLVVFEGEMVTARGQIVVL
jgi:hypothetical protein